MNEVKKDKVREAIEKQLDKVLYFCEIENVSYSTAVHEVRKSFKRMRALLRFYDREKYPFQASMRKTLSDYGRVLSPYRNSCVNLQVAERLLKEKTLIPDRNLKALKEVLLEQNKKILHNDLMKANVRMQIYAYFKEVQSELYSSDWGMVKEDFVSQYIDAYQKSLDLYSGEGLYAVSEKLHELRKALKVMWYQSNFLKFLNPRFFKHRSDRLDLVTELLGEEHDLFVFMQDIKEEGHGLDEKEILQMEKTIHHQRDLVMDKLRPKLKKVFRDSVEELVEKLKGKSK